MTTTEPGTTLGGTLGKRVPRRIRQLSWRTWRGVVVRSVQNFVTDNCSDWAAALTYYGVLALFPSAIVVVALVGLVSNGEQTVDTVVDLARQLGAGAVVADKGSETGVVGVIRSVVVEQGHAKVLLSFGLLGALWSASGFIGAFTRASNAIYGVTEGRPVWKLRPLQIGLAAITLVLLAVVALGLIVSGPVTDAVGDLINAGGLARTVWSVAKWPVLALIMMVLLSLLFWIAPNVRQPRFRWLTPGGAVALFAWAVASFGFSLYVANFGSYGATYGSLGAAIAFLVWLYLSNSALMLGVQINAEVQRGRRLQAGDPDPEEPVLPPRKPAGS
ncbi:MULTISPECIES: YihY/virulence factor BrkB family protein [unclassified Micromonospora]|uniref:YihY/virulence factor BrkB family protein n=1 Tax=unclassified Micromonospora TaxID=2617518 RepID=UPI000EF474F0|nr:MULTISPECIES: YihY/virulence factor BrkB family protein [unclassified Micromonospora]RLP94319.1 YihY/virulence factor BrkB family protein [Micromonospora sp. BL4]RLP98644.1 YihY/virulence factor BrkB family protein [Micromonospora sp. CV4]